MADIRTTGMLDDFERPNETPIQAPWLFAGFSATTANLVGGRFQGGPGDTQYIFQGEGSGPFDVSQEDIEVWGQVGPGADLTEALRIGWFTTGGSGIMLIIINGLGPVVWNIRSYSSGGFSTVQSVEHAFPLGSPHDYVLMQIRAGVLRTYVSHDSGDNWTGPINNIGASGSGLYPMLGTSSDDGGNPSWMAFGGKEEDIPQIYRRPND